MTKNRDANVQPVIGKGGLQPSLNVRKLGIVSRDYRIKFPNGYRDFSYSFPHVVKLLDDEGCDTVLFSLFSIIPRKGYDCRTALDGLKNIRTILLEEFQDRKTREVGRYLIYHCTTSGWKEYEFYQVFASVTGMHKEEMDNFVKNEVPKRIVGNCCVLLCGETNGVKYSKYDKKIHDTFGLREAIPPTVHVILNPIHDRMTRFEMKLKRQFLSENNRWVISVWNKGKQDKNGKTKDGTGPAWTVFHNKDDIYVRRIQNNFGVEIGTLNMRGT